jgi:hypothetical protein
MGYCYFCDWSFWPTDRVAASNKFFLNSLLVRVFALEERIIRISLFEWGAHGATERAVFTCRFKKFLFAALAAAAAFTTTPILFLPLWFSFVFREKNGVVMVRYRPDRNSALGNRDERGSMTATLISRSAGAALLPAGGRAFSGRPASVAV